MRLSISLLRRHLPNQQNWVGRTVLVENNDVDKAMSVSNFCFLPFGLLVENDKYFFLLMLI